MSRNNKVPVDEGWIKHLRKSTRENKDKDLGRSAMDSAEGPLHCPTCKDEVFPDFSSFQQHLQTDIPSHVELDTEAAIQEARRKTTHEKSLKPAQLSQSSRKRPPGDNNLEGDDSNSKLAESSQSKKICSPPASDIQQRGSSPSTPTTRPRQLQSPIDHNRGGFSRGKQPTRKLFDPGPSASGIQQSSQSKATQRQPNETAEAARIDPNRPHTSMCAQPATKPISHEQLVAEVKGIYTGLVMIEAKCIEVDTAQSSNTDHQLTTEQWQALIALHRTLLHEHHDFFLASQHPAASDALRRLAAKYAMPARMWRHGIHSFLELLRHRLPASYDQMLTFIYLAYGMMALLYETVPAFIDTWIECLGDLARYRMAIEDSDIKDRETWTGVARSWYSLASEKAPTIGRLYHHLAILARPNAVQQLYFYVKSLCVPIPFPSARDSIMTLFDPLFSPTPPKIQPVDAAFVRVHAIFFSGKHEDKLDESMKDYLDTLDGFIGRMAKRWLEIGYHTGIPLACSLLGYGSEDHFMMKAIRQQQQQQFEGDVAMEDSMSSESLVSDKKFEASRSFLIKTYEIVVRRWGDPNTLPFIHTLLVFMLHVSRTPAAMLHLEKVFPWKLTATMLNFLHHSCKVAPRIDTKDFPGALPKELPRPLPEDWAMQGLTWAEDVYPLSWFRDSRVEEDEKYFELASMTDQRQEKILWLGRRLADAQKWLTWDERSRTFDVVEQYATGSDDGPFNDTHEQGLVFLPVLRMMLELNHSQNQERKGKPPRSEMTRTETSRARK